MTQGLDLKFACPVYFTQATELNNGPDTPMGHGVRDNSRNLSHGKVNGNRLGAAKGHNRIESGGSSSWNNAEKEADTARNGNRHQNSRNGYTGLKWR